MKLLDLLTFSPLLSLASAACNADNCLRALRATPTKASAFCSTYTRTTSTATAIATYDSFCFNSPSRVSSACSCVVTASPVPICRPSPVINAATRNGNFEDYPPPGQGVFNIQPPGITTNVGPRTHSEITKPSPPVLLSVAHLAPLREPLPHSKAFHLTGQSPGVLPGAVLRLNQPISYCNGTTYAFSLYARQLPPLNQDCSLSFFTDFEGTIATFETPVFSSTFQKFGPVTRKPFRDNGEINEKGEYTDLLSVLVQCTGIAGQPVADTLFEVDAVRIEPVP